jgi:hypothetical protein
MSDFYYEDDNKQLPEWLACEDAWVEENKLQGRSVRPSTEPKDLAKWAGIAAWCRVNSIHPSFPMRAMARQSNVAATKLGIGSQYWKKSFQSVKHLVENCWENYMLAISYVPVQVKECANAETVSLLVEVQTIMGLLEIRKLDLDAEEDQCDIEKIVASDLLNAGAAARIAVMPDSDLVIKKYIQEFLDWEAESHYRTAAMQEVSGISVEQIRERSGL